MGDTYPKFKAASVQDSPVFLDRKATVEKACGLMKRAGREGAKLVAFPESYVPGYPYWIWLDIPSANYRFFQKFFEEALVIPGPDTEALCRGAREADVYVVIGVNEKLSTQMGTMWNTNVIIDNRGNIIGRHRKIVPTFAEKMVWSRGDGSGLKVWETDLGRIGTLACGNNTHSLYKYALIAQGEQIHVANYPAFNTSAQADLAVWNRIRTGAHSMEGKLFNLCSTSTVNEEMVETLCGGDEKKKEWMAACRAYSGITGPSGNTLAELIDKDDILYADIDISEIITAKQFHDITGHYTRMDVVSLNLNQEEDRPVWYKTDSKHSPKRLPEGGDPVANTDADRLKKLEENQLVISQNLKLLNDLINILLEKNR